MRIGLSGPRTAAPQVPVALIRKGAVRPSRRLAERVSYFPNFAFYWAPQALMLGALLPFKPRPAIVAGTALALTVYFIAFSGWASEAMAWLSYPMGFPGAIVGAVSALLIARRRPLISAMRAGCYAAALTAAGVALMPAGLALELYGRFRWW